MQNYEMLCVLPGTLAEDEVMPIVEKIKETLSNKKAENISVKDMGKSKLAYPIKHIRYGYFQLFHFELDSNELKELETSVRLLDLAIRMVVRKYDPATAKDYVLAVDPTALSAKEKPEFKRENRTFKRERPENVLEKTELEKENTESAETETEKDLTETTKAKVSKSKITKIKKETKGEKISIDDIDKKLEEILQKDIENV
jgi:small subunit ribosomal protein S6